MEACRVIGHHHRLPDVQGLPRIILMRVMTGNTYHGLIAEDHRGGRRPLDIHLKCDRADSIMASVAREIVISSAKPCIL